MPCLQKRGKGLAPDIRDLSTRYEDIVIDAGGQDSVELRAALTIADLALFPIQPSLFDATTLETLAELFAQAQAFNNRELAKADLGDQQGAIADYNQALEINPRYAEVYYNRGLVKATLGDQQGAIADYAQALEINPQLAVC